MPTEVPEEELYRLVVKKAELERKRIETRIFYVHFGFFSVVNIILAIIWRVTGAGFPWFAIPLGIWGIAILLHFVVVALLAGRGPRAQNWVRTVTEREVKRLKEVGVTSEQMEELREADRLNKGGN